MIFRFILLFIFFFGIQQAAAQIETTAALKSISSARKDSLSCDIFYVANIISPNSEIAQQDYFIPSFNCPPQQYEMWIYDRWGNPIFETRDYTKGWDGTMNGNQAQIDVYVWKIKCVLQPGEKQNNYTGKVNLIR
jgi:gliding motility-associated-like protein